MRIATRMLAALALPLFAGCLSPLPPPPSYWTVTGTPIPARTARPCRDAVPARLARLEVLAPFSRTQFCVMRPDGTLAYDSYNEFAAPPASILWGPALASLSACGDFGLVVGPACGATTGTRLELVVTRMALDCRRVGQREALVELQLNVLKDRLLESVRFGSASVGTADGDYTTAFSKAFANALRDAVGRYARSEER